jgi:hypothetical protein
LPDALTHTSDADANSFVSVRRYNFSRESLAVVPNPNNDPIILLF